MAIDGTSQVLGWRESNNKLRIITGLLFGIGLSTLVLSFEILLGYKLALV
jgi:uncharacterized membrane protein